MINLNYENITFGLGVLGVLFGIYHYFRNPQIKSDENLLVLSSKYDALNALVVNLRDNHIHSIDEKLVAQEKSLNNLNVSVEKLSTIIEERMPRARRKVLE